MDKNNNSENTTGRVIWFDPNMADNKMVNTEDLSIKVDFSAKRKDRSVIYAGNMATSTAGGGGSVQFIEGSRVNNSSEQPSLTTRYTEVIALDIMNNTQQSFDDFESLGIESIDIEFNTANAPMVKIKFIDIRGNSILSQGNTSKYRMFFELPYPIFSLKIKGFYGKTVNYCLHLQRWNASFNSNSGNFEIQAEFIGYTYALLTDMLMGLIRASVKTERGVVKLQAKKDEYGTNSDLVISIDDMLDRLNDLNFTFNKLSENDESVKQINTHDIAIEDINKIITIVNEFGDSIYDGTNYFRSLDSQVFGLPNDSSTIENYYLKLSEFKTKFENAINNYNTNITDTFKLSPESLLDSIVIIKDISSNLFNSGSIDDASQELINTIIIKSDSNYNNTDECVKDRIRPLIKKIKSAPKTNFNDKITNIYNFSRIYYKLNDTIKELVKNKKELSDKIITKVVNETKSNLGFEPTIRNIFRVFTINTEIFLEVLRDVSIAAQTDADGKRGVEFNKIIGTTGNLNVQPGNDGKTIIYPWPEYRENKNNKGYVESWLGKAPGVNGMNIEEVVFVEEILKALMDVARHDNELDTELEAGIDIDSLPEQVENPWYPISVIDTPLTEGITENPYISVIQNGNSDEVIRLLIMRGFLLLGISNYDSKLSDELIKIYGRLEAANLYEVAKKTQVGLDIIKRLQNVGNKTSPSDQRDYILSVNGLVGKDTITNPNKEKKRPIFEISQDNSKYIYTYIKHKYENINKYFIPINKNYDGVIFDEFETPEDDTVYIDNIVSTTNTFDLFTGASGGLALDNLKSYVFKIIDKSKYDSMTMVPNFGSNIIEDYKTKYGGYGKLIAPNTFINAFKNDGKLLHYIDPFFKFNVGGEPTPNNYSALDINKLNLIGLNSAEPYDGIPSELPIRSTVSSFYYEQNEPKWKVGSYLCTIGPSSYYEKRMPKEDNEKFNIKNFWDRSTNIEYKEDIFEIDTRGGLGSRPFTNFGRQKRNITLLRNGDKSIFLPFIEFGVDEYNTYSLFGSKLYNYQNMSEVKALLFLHSLPWQGVITSHISNLEENRMFDTFNTTNETIYDLVSIKSMFKINGGFINAPKAWVLFIGAMLWRYEYGNTETGDVNVITNSPEINGDPIIWGIDTGLIPGFTGREPNIDEFLYYSESLLEPWGLYLNNNSRASNDDYVTDKFVPIDKTLLGLPFNVRGEFINYFLNWVTDDTGFKYIQKELELWTGRDYGNNFNEYKTLWNKFNTECENNSVSSDLTITPMNTKFISDLFKDNPNILNNYVSVAPAKDRDTTLNLNSQFQLELRPNTSIMNDILGLLSETVYLQNVKPETWEPKRVGFTNIEADRNKFRLFIESFFTELDSKNPNNEVTEDDQTQQEIFGTMDDNAIKLNIYRTLSSINDKWINGTGDNSNIFSQCSSCPSCKNKKDLDIAKQYRTNPDNTTLIDTFRFVDRAFADIGDDFYLNINKISELVKHEYNKSFFDVVNKILIDNNFNFIPLPTFINFNDINELKSVFTPYSYNDEVGFSGTGPSFVCVYVGQTSTSLDLGVGSVYPDDGLSLSNDNGTLSLTDESQDFTSDLTPNDLIVPVFAVNYGQQNQNYFKNVNLDQREFSETMESLQIIEEISQNGDKSQPTRVGNNLFNVYQTRSYSAEVQMLGSAMIQPMMYFQLNNIPMFRGAYLIYKVNHNITPHNMTTTFKGNRVKKTKTPLLDKDTMYMNLINTNGGNASITSSRGPNSGPPIVATLYSNGVSYSNIDAGQIKGCEVKDISGVKFMSVQSKRMICEAVTPLTEMIKDWVSWMKNEGFVGVNNGKTFAYITSMFRTKGESSYHSLGIALDFQFFKKNGTIIQNEETNINNLKMAFSFKENPALKWLYNHAYEYGFVQPYWANDGRGVGNSDGEEWWHWEYHGKSAICILRKQPIPALGNNSPSDNPLDQIKESKIKSFVKNPKKPDGTESVYSGCEYSKISYSDAANGINMNVIEESTKISNSTAAANQVTVKNMLKAKGISKEAAAGIMGNIQKESVFDPNAFNPEDTGGTTDYGLIQWNSKYHPNPKTEIGTTVEEQINYLFTRPGYKSYIKKLVELSNQGKRADAAEASYWFAKLVEVCAGCTGTYDNYLTGKAKVRASYAKNFFTRFETNGDPLKW
jgi:hypothetical protein